LDLDYREYRKDFFGLGTHRGTLFHALYGEIEKEQIPIHSNATITKTRVASGKDPLVSERYIIDEKTGIEYGPYDLVIQASGTHSNILKHESNQVPEIQRNIYSYPFGSLWTNCPDPDGTFSQQRNIIQKYYEASYMAGIMPCGRIIGTEDPLVSLFWSLRKDHADEFLSDKLSLDEWYVSCCIFSEYTNSTMQERKTIYLLD
jgi:salicylate hydroxylase